MTPQRLITIDQFKADLCAQGITFAQWADDHGFARILVYRTMAGVIKGRHGIGHAILVAAGVKPQPITDRRDHHTDRRAA